MEIIPAIDIIEGKCVRLTAGNYAQKTIYNEKPLDVAYQFEDAGLKRLHLVDLDGAKAGAVKNWKTIETIASKTKLIIDFGGGIVTESDLKIAFNAGAALIAIGSIAIKAPDTLKYWLYHYGVDKFLLGADVKEEKIAINGWLENTNVALFDFIESYLSIGIQQIFCTDISKDGKLEGPSLDLYKRTLKQFPTLQLIASGGVSSIQDVFALEAIGCSGVIIGKAIYEGKISLTELKQYIN